MVFEIDPVAPREQRVPCGRLKDTLGKARATFFASGMLEGLRLFEQRRVAYIAAEYLKTET